MYPGKKTVSDVLEYLYQNKQKELAQVILDELRQQREIVRETVIPAKTVAKPSPTPYTTTYTGDLRS